VACYKICNVRVNAPRRDSQPAEQQPASLANSSNASKKGLLSPHVEEVTKAMDLEPNAHEKVLRRDIRCGAALPNTVTGM